MPDNRRNISLSLPADLLAQIDAAAKAQYSSRSDYIRQTLLLRLSGDRVVDNKHHIEVESPYKIHM